MLTKMIFFILLYLKIKKNIYTYVLLEQMSRVVREEKTPVKRWQLTIK